MHARGSRATRLGWTEDEARIEALPVLVQAAEGETTRHDVVLGEARACVLLGRLTAGDRIREGYAQLLLEGPHALRIAFSGVDEEGRFELETRIPGRHRLVIDAGSGHHQYHTVSDLVELALQGGTWERELSIEVWEAGVRLDPH